MIRPLVPTLALLCATASASPVLLNDADWKRVQSQPDTVTALTKGCDKLTSYTPKPVATFAPDPHYTAEGVNDTANNAKGLAADALAAYRLGLCYRLTGNAQAAGAAQRILDAWAGTLKTIKGDQGKAAINFNLPYLTAAASWVRGANGWDGVAFGQFLRDTIMPLSVAKKPNNHGAWAMLMESSIAAYLNDKALMQQARTRWQSLLLGAIDKKGVLTREIERSGTNNWRGGPDKGKKGLAYTHYFLLPASLAAKNFADAGQPVWNTPAGKRLGAAFAQAAAWTLKPQTFPYYASNNGQLEAVRSAPYFALLQRIYPNKDAAAVLKGGDITLNGFRLLELFGP